MTNEQLLAAYVALAPNANWSLKDLERLTVLRFHIKERGLEIPPNGFKGGFPATVESFKEFFG